MCFPRQCRQEIEDYLFDLIKKHEPQGKEEKEKASFHVKPQAMSYYVLNDAYGKWVFIILTSCSVLMQASSFVMEEKEKMTSGIRKIKDAFTVSMKSRLTDWL